MGSMMEAVRAMPKMLSGKDLVSALTILPAYDDGIRNENEAVRLIALSDLYNIYLPSQMSMEIYSKLYLSLLRSLQKKHTTLAMRQRYENNRAIQQPSPWKDLQKQILSIVIEKGVTTIGDSAFYQCSTLTDITFSDTLVSIGSCAFYECESLTKVILPEGIKSFLGDNAFANCTKLSKIHIPSTITDIGSNPFIVLPNLETITVAENNPSYFVEDGVLFNKDMSIIIKYPAKKPGNDYTIPSTVTTIGCRAFEFCDNLVNVNIPGSVTSIESGAFTNCTSLTQITIPDSTTDIDAYVFNNCSALVDAVLPKTMDIIGEYTFGNCTSLNRVVMPENLGYLCHSLFADCTSLKEIIFNGYAPELISENIFLNVIATAYYPAKNPTWTEDVMQDYGGDITWVAVMPATSGACGDNLTWEFSQESGKLSVSGTGEMYNADKLDWTVFSDEIQTVEIGSGATSIGAYAFSDCTKLTDVEISSTVMDISYNAFENCRSLTAIDLPDELDSIGENAFQNCSRLKAVDVPDSVMEISYAAFMDCTSLATAELPQTLKSIGDHAFDNCTSLNEIDIPDTVMDITYNAFDNCTSLTEIEFPADLELICAKAFRDCSSLEEMRFLGNAPKIQSNAFYNVLANAYYPAENTTWTEDKLLNYGGNLTWIAEGEVVIPDNSCGENITWAFEESSGTLTISGTESVARSNGNSVMDDYASPEETPWFPYQDQIVTVVIESTVDSVGKNAFSGCSSLTTVIIEEGISEIDSTAFSGCDSLESCYYEGSKEAWDDLGADVGEANIHVESADPETHTETKTTIAPTCTEQGYDLYTCACGIQRKDNFTAATGHSWDEGTVTKEPTAEESGIKTYTCTVCKETRTEEIPYEAPSDCPVKRISGKDRVKTALSVATALKEALGVEKFNAVVIAIGDNEKFADALAGSYLANVKGAPILLYTSSGLSDLNVAFIEENLVENGTIYLLGGSAAIPDDVKDQLSAYGNVVRLSGKSRYETNLAILNEAGYANADEILVATGTNFADSLSASAVGLPILLVNGKKTELTAEQIEFLEGLKGTKVTIIGGTGAVSAEIETAIENIVGIDVGRISGKTRHNTSVLIAETYLKNPTCALLTYSQNFPDGLAGGPLAYALGAPLLLTNAGNEAIANEYITENEIDSGYILGGTAAVSDETAKKVFALADNAVITKAYYTE